MKYEDMKILQSLGDGSL